MTMTAQKERERQVEMTIYAGTGSIRFKGLAARDDGQLPYIRILIHKAQQKMMVQFVNKKTRDDVQPLVSDDDPNVSFIEKCGIFIDRLYRMMSWDSALDYTLTGTPSEIEDVPGVLFDLTESEAFPYERRTYRRMAPGEWSERMVGQ